MNFVKENIRDFYLRDVQIETIFINEYLPAAPGDYVKVYIYGYMYAELGLEMSNARIAQQLGLSEKKVNEAWEYWEKMGTIRKLYLDRDGKIDFTVEFMNLKSLMYGKGDYAKEPSEQESVQVFGNEGIRQMFDRMENLLGRTMSSTEVKRVLAWVSDYKIRPDVVLYGLEYCLEKGKDNLRYVESVLKGWNEEGLLNVEDVTRHLSEVDQRFYQYRRVLRALGFQRNATEEEKRMMDSWFDMYGFSMDRVLEACAKTAGIASPNFNYVNKVLVNWKSEAQRRGDGDVNKKITINQAQLRKYYSYLREKEAREADERLAEIYSKIPRIREIDRRSTELGATLSKALILGSEGDQGPEIREQMERLAEERAVQLTDHDYPMDYTDIHYLCEKCHDTGITDLGERCSCAIERTEEAEIWYMQGGENGENRQS
ncbi:MAG: DnaD domain protein [Eubacterium sp.]|nr:DnaD domain protein [Eubacterium sp.]